MAHIAQITQQRKNRYDKGHPLNAITFGEMMYRRKAFRNHIIGTPSGFFPFRQNDIIILCIEIGPRFASRFGNHRHSVFGRRPFPENVPDAHLWDDLTRM